MYKLLVVAVILFCLIGTPATANDEEPPSLELLEFLGEWSDGDDGWFDPSELAGMELPKQERDNDETEK